MIELLAPSERRIAERLQLNDDDIALYLDLQRELINFSPWFALGLERGWLSSDVVTDGSYTWQGAIILGIDNEQNQGGASG